MRCPFELVAFPGRLACTGQITELLSLHNFMNPSLIINLFLSIYIQSIGTVCLEKLNVTVSFTASQISGMDRKARPQLLLPQ